eukprot:superscaffoldBa00000992_g8400
MTDPATQESYPVPDPTIVDPCPAPMRNGQCAPDGFTNNHHQQAKTPGQTETFTTGQEMKITDSVEGEGLLESSMRLKPHEAQNYRKKALWVSWISIVVTLILAVAAFSGNKIDSLKVNVTYTMIYLTGSVPSALKVAVICPLPMKPTLDPEVLASYSPIANLPFLSNVFEWVGGLVELQEIQHTLCVLERVREFVQEGKRATLGDALLDKATHRDSICVFFDATLDVLSSVIVLWRYSNAAAVHSAHREYIACVVLGIVFVLSSLCILGKAIHDLATRMPPEVDDFLFSVSIVSGLTCAVLAVAKFMLGRVLTSRALITDGFNSMVGAIMGFSILISAEVFKHHTDVWFLDGTIGVLIGLIILAYGVKKWLLLTSQPGACSLEERTT